MYDRMIKVHNMFKINNKTPVCLEKAVFGKLFRPIIHFVNGVKILTGSMYNYLSSLGFYGNESVKQETNTLPVLFQQEF